MGIITIKTIVKKGADLHTTTGSLAHHGYSRSPGCFARIPPFREIDGSYRTGLDENALYIKKMPLEEQETEKVRCRELQKKLETITGLDLSSRAPYYTNMNDEHEGTLARAAMLKIGNDPVILDVDGEDVQQAITAAWAQVHPFIAPSYADIRNGKVSSDVIYYISDKGVETAIAFDESKAINKAIVTMDGMTPLARKRIARLMDLSVSDSSTEDSVYILLDKTLKAGEIKIGGYKGSRAVKVFNDLVDMKEETLNIKDLVKQALNQGIYRKYKNAIFQGEVKMFENEKELVLEITTDTQARIALEKQVNNKKKLAE